MFVSTGQVGRMSTRSSCQVSVSVPAETIPIHFREQISVAIRQLGEGGVWRCGEGDPRAAALLMCDIRRGRPAQQRAELARMPIHACQEIVGLREDSLNVEFTQHAGDEMYHPLYGGLSDDWKAGEPDRLGKG